MHLQRLERHSDQRNIALGLLSFQPPAIGNDAHMRDRDVEHDGMFLQIDDLGRAQAGFDHHLTKPVDPAALTRLLVSLLTETGSRASGSVAT